MSTKATTDIYFAAVLLSMGARLEKTDRTDPRHMVFHFSSPTKPLPLALTGNHSTIELAPTVDLDKAETDWVNRTLSINAYELCEAVKRMKSIVHTHS